MVLRRIRTPRVGARLAGLAVLLFTCLSAAPSRAQHAFDYAFDRFEVDGNRYGAFDGVPDLIENFDAFGTFLPALGTAQVSGGLLHLKDPWTAIPLNGPTGIRIELDDSLVLNTSGPMDGAGDFTATAVLRAQPIAVNDAVTFGATGIGTEVVALVLSNLDANLAAATGIQQGYALSLLFLTSPTNVVSTIIDVSSVRINPSSVTGDVVFKMSFDDASNMLTASFSLDGGASFRTPFAPMAIFRGASSYNFLLYADPEELPGVTTTTIATTITTTMTSRTTTTNTLPPPGGTQPVSGRRLTLKDNADPARRGITAQSKDLAISLGGGNGSADDPVVSGGGSLRVRTTDGCSGPCDTTYPLTEAGAWTYIRHAGDNKGYKYKAMGGLIRTVTVQPGAMVKVTGKGQLGHRLAAQPDPVDVVLQIGARQYCMRFGGTSRFVVNQVFTAEDAPAPGACPP